MGGSDDEVVRSISADRNGDVILTGSFTGSASFEGRTLTSAGGTDLFLAKYDALGNSPWAIRLGDSGNGDKGTAVITDADGNIVLAGSLGQKFFLSKYDSGGNELHSIIYPGFGTVGNEIQGLSLDPLGNILVTGNVANWWI